MSVAGNGGGCGGERLWVYLVGFVVVLRVVLEDLWLLHVHEVPDQVIRAEIFPPLFAGNEPAGHRQFLHPKGCA